MRMLVASTLAAVLVCAPASEAAPACHGGQPAIRRISETGGDYVRVRLVRCDGAVLVRRRLRTSPDRHGTQIVEADARGRRLAWIEESFSRRAYVVRLVQADTRDGRVYRRRTLVRSRPLPVTPALGLALVGRGVAWLVGGAVRTQSPGQPSRIVARGRDLHGPIVVDDDRTLRFGRGRHKQWVDVRPAVGRGCPRRRGWEAVTATDQAVLTKRTYRPNDEGFEESAYGTAYRLCARTLGRDPVVAQSHTQGHGGEFSDPEAVAGPWALFYGYSYTYMDSSGCRLSVSRAGRSLPSRTALLPCPSSVESAALTPSGAPIVRLRDADEPHLERILTVSRDGRAIVLDEAPEGALSGVRVDGETLRWRNGDEDRSAPAS